MTQILRTLGVIAFVSMANANFNNYLLSLAQLLDLKQITIVNGMDKEIKLMRQFSKHGIRTSIKNFHDMEGYVDDLMILINDIDSSSAILNAVKYMKKGILIFESFQAVKEVVDILKCHINQQIYLYDMNSFKLHETWSVCQLSSIFS